MRDFQQAAKDLLYLGNAWDEAQIFTFYLFDGTDVRRWTSAGHDITYNGDTYAAGVVGIKAGDSVEESGTGVSTLDLELCGTISLGGAPLTQAALGMTFGGARVVVQTLFLSGPYGSGSVVDACTDFDGKIYDVNPGTYTTKLQAKSPTAKADAGKGYRVVGATCGFIVYGTECGATVQEGAATVASGSTVRSVVLSAASVYAVPGSRILFTSGPMSGAAYLIRSVSGATVVPDQDLPQSPAAGTTCIIRRGCDGTIGGCRALGNMLRNGGASMAPTRDLFTPTE